MVNLFNESLATTFMALADLICKQLHKLKRATINVSILVYQGLFADKGWSGIQIILEHTGVVVTDSHQSFSGGRWN
jgi:hypothetical protein